MKAAIIMTMLAALAATSARAEVCEASYYHEGQRTANGERYNSMAATCAHKTHRFGTTLRVIHLGSGAVTECRVNDRGPFIRGRCIDLSVLGARQIGIIKAGRAKVRVDVVR